MGIRRISVLIPEEMHRALRAQLARDETNLSDWLRGRIEEYVGRKEGRKPPIVMPPVPRPELLPRVERRRRKRG